MKYIFLNLKRFDILPQYGGVNKLAPAREWGACIAAALHAGIARSRDLGGNISVAAFLPEAHILGAAAAIPPESALEIGCQSVHYEDTSPGANFGAFTTLRTANSAKQLGCVWTIIGHSEERRHMTKLMTLAGAKPEAASRAISALLRMQVESALRAGLRVLFCVGETAEQVSRRLSILRSQIEESLDGADMSRIVLAYEPVWAIGPGKTPPEAREITDIAAGIKEIAACPLVYGGGLKKDNAASIGSITALDGGLVALTRFNGEIGFYPDEFFEIVDAYLDGIAKGEATL